MSHVFISYSRADRELHGKLETARLSTVFSLRLHYSWRSCWCKLTLPSGTTQALKAHRVGGAFERTSGPPVLQGLVN